MALVLAVVLPVCAATVMVVVFSSSELLGYTLWSYGPTRNLAEAAALGSASEVVRRLDAGEDPAGLAPVRPYAISSSVTRVTALEAAVWSRSAELMQLLDRARPVADVETRHHLTCLAQDLHVDEVVEYLSPEAPPKCVPGQSLERVIARSREPQL